MFLNSKNRIQARLRNLASLPVPRGAVTLWKRSSALRQFVPLFTATLLWGLSLSGIDISHMNDMGLVSVLPISTMAAFLILVAGYVALLLQRQVDARIFLLYNLVLILMIHGTPNILYGTLRYPWAWKHVGIIDYIQRHGEVNPQIGILGVYHNWPGFFALGALITEVAGLQNALTIAGWAPVFNNILFLSALLLVFKALSLDRRMIWLSVWLFILTNWVGQDYFSPQAFGFFLYLIILGISLIWFRTARPFQGGTLARLRIFNWTLPLLEHHSGFKQPAKVQEAFTRSSQRPGFAIVLLMLFGGIVSSHQLTPFMAISAILVLVIFHYCRWWSLPFLMIAMTLLWYIFPAETFFFGKFTSIIDSMGRLGQNVDSSLVNLSRISQGQVFVAMMARGLSASIGLLAFLGAIRRIRKGYLDLAAILLTVAPMPMLLINSYGGEMLFRIYFFSLPFMAFLAAGLFFPDSDSGTTWKTSVTIGALSVVLMVGLSFAYYGKDNQYHFTKEEVDAVQYLFNNAKPNSLLIEGSHNYPSQFRNYEFFTYVPIDREPPESRERVLDDPVEVLTRWMSNDDEYAQSYLIITRSQKVYVDALGIMPPGSLDRIERLLSQSPNFRLVFSNDDAKIFTLRER